MPGVLAAQHNSLKLVTHLSSPVHVLQPVKREDDEVVPPKKKKSKKSKKDKDKDKKKVRKPFTCRLFMDGQRGAPCFLTIASWRNLYGVT